MLMRTSYLSEYEQNYQDNLREKNRVIDDMENTIAEKEQELEELFEYKKERKFLMQ